MHLNFDERCAADLAGVREGRSLAPKDAAWLTRVVVGAVRPNRDRPLWDLAHALAALSAASSEAVLDLCLDPELAVPHKLAARLAGTPLAAAAALDERGLVFERPGMRFRTTFAGLSRLLALAEFALTADELAHFATVKGWIDELCRAGGDGPALDAMVRRLAKLMADYRAAHLPLAAVERRFRAILTFLAERHGAASAGHVHDDDIVDYFARAAEAGQRVMFLTVVDHFLTYDRTREALGDLARLGSPTALAEIDDWEDRLEAIVVDPVDEPSIGAVLDQALQSVPDGPKILTAVERAALSEVFALAPFHRTRPRTTARALSFGKVQSGIANRLRRGGGGPSISERVRCAEAESYAALCERAGRLDAHLKKVLRIALALRMGVGEGETADEVLAKGREDLKRMRRAGFERPEAALRADFAAVDEALARLAQEFSAFLTALQGLGEGRGHQEELGDGQRLDALFRRDRERFAAILAAMYRDAEGRDERAPSVAG